MSASPRVVWVLAGGGSDSLEVIVASILGASAMRGVGAATGVLPCVIASILTFPSRVFGKSGRLVALITGTHGLKGGDTSGTSIAVGLGSCLAVDS